jgi:putative transposase
MSDDTPSPLNNVITIERIKSHLDRVVRGTVEETLNALLDAEADRLCNAQRYERSASRRDSQQPARAHPARDPAAHARRGRVP